MVTDKGPMGPSSYVVLGLVRDFGPCTPYDLRQVVASSIGYFWHFPQSQLYAEANRLVGLGLLDEVEASSGRRRRVVRVTADGLDALDGWLADTTPSQSEIRDLGLLKLFFTSSRRDLVRLAKGQAAAHRERLAEYEALDAEARPVALPQQLRTLEMGLRFERAAVAFWDSVAEDPPAGPRRRAPRTA